MFVPWALLLHILYGFHMFCVVYTATLYHWHCCFIYCMLCTATCLVPTALLLHILYPVYCMFVSWVLLLHILHAVYCCMFCTYLGHCCFIYCKLCTATSFLLMALLLHILQAVYCHKFFANGTAARFIKFCHRYCALFHRHCCFIYCMLKICCMLCTHMFWLWILALHIHIMYSILLCAVRYYNSVLYTMLFHNYVACCLPPHVCALGIAASHTVYYVLPSALLCLWCML